MKKERFILISILFILSITVMGCGKMEDSIENSSNEDNEWESEEVWEKRSVISLDSEVRQLERGLSVVQYEGDYGYAILIREELAAQNKNKQNRDTISRQFS